MGDLKQTELKGALIEGVRNAQGSMHRAAILWTYLERNLSELGTLEDRNPGLDMGDDPEKWAVVTEDDLASLEREPLAMAAKLLGRIGRHARVKGGAKRHQKTWGVKGEKVWVAWRHGGGLSTMFRGKRDEDDSLPPSAQHSPSLAAIARHIVVFPRVDEEQKLRLEYRTLLGIEWFASNHLLEEGVKRDRLGIVKTPLKVHLDPLVDPVSKRIVGTSGWREKGTRSWLKLDAGHDGNDVERDPEDVERDREDECAAVDQTERAVRHASGHPSILILPELSATAKAEGRAASTLEDVTKNGGEPPALTVVGLNHRKLSPDQLPAATVATGETPLRDHVNEAVVLGSKGKELWRQRKISFAQRYAVKDPDEQPDAQATVEYEQISYEGNLSGSKITMVETPIGTVAVTICLDSFAEPCFDLVSQSAINVILVPSLSPHVDRHRTALLYQVQRLWGVAFVCNRALRPGEPPEVGWSDQSVRSFWVAQRCRDVIRPEIPTDATHMSYVCEPLKEK